jgi:DNA-binding response OmpR family regulator
MTAAMRSILVIDGSLTVRMDLDEGFRAAGWKTTLCASAGAAREALTREPFDAIILDVLLPDASGLDLLRELKTSRATGRAPVILLSAQADVPVLAEGPGIAADAYVGPSYDRDYLVLQAERLADRAPRVALRPPVILAIDDSPTYLNELASELHGDNYEVIVAESGHEAVEHLSRHEVDCILLDMLMPGVSGQELCRQVKGSPQWRAIPVIMLTGREDREAILESFNAGADDYVAKSSDFAILRARLNAQLRRRQFEQEAQQIREQLHRKDLEVAEIKAAGEASRRVEEDLRAANLSAERARAAAEDANRAKDHFLAILSHELRTPLAPVLAAVSLLDQEQLADQARERLDLIRRNVELQARLIDDLLDLTRIVRGKVELDKRHVDLRTVLERAAEVCRPDVDARRLHFGVDYGPTRPFIVDADAARLQQVFWNLMKNAIKFTPQGGCVGLTCRAEGAHVVVDVNDSGIGIEPSAIGRIFDAFAQAELSITRQFGGLGLGLAISRVLVEMHGGTIVAQSPGKDMGATFTVRLPMIESGTTVAGHGEARDRSEASGRSLTILLVEDHGDTAEMMASMLELSGHQVRRAGDVAAALDLATDGRFDVLISDLGLPDRSGLDLMRDLRMRGDMVPAIALSGYGQEKDLAESRAAGFQLHLVKPVDVDRVLAAIDRVVSGSSRAFKE